MTSDSELIMVPVTSRRQITRLSPLLIPLAQRRQATLVLLHMLQPHFGRLADASVAESWLQEAVQDMQAQGVAAQWQQKKGYNLAGMIREAVAELHPTLLVLSWQRKAGEEANGVPYDLQDLLLDVPCPLLIWRGNTSTSFRPRRILLPSAGGPNAAWALNLGRDLAAAYDGQLTLLSVQPQKADESRFREADQRIRELLAAKQVGTDELAAEQIHISLQRASSPVQGILDAANSGDYDLLMIGATQEGVLSRLLFGEIPDRVARQSDIPVVIIKRPLPRRITWARRTFMALQNATPTLSEAEKIQAYRAVRRDTRTDADFLTMVSLATLIATLGLLLNSPAVVIGAMLVAPLMSAIVALGLAVVQGDSKLLRLALGSAARGIALSVGVALVVGLLTPGDHQTAEMAARTSPTLLDLAVALASGAAGAYALCRKDVATSLPGVAIAVALVPPLATVGLALSQGDWTMAGGAGLLFLTNLVAIATAGGVVFLLLGFQPEGKRPARLRLFTRGWWVMLLLLALIASLLGGMTWHTAQVAARSRALQAAVRHEMAAMPGVELRRLSGAEGDGGELQVMIEVGSTRTLSSTEARALQDALTSALARPVALVLQVIPTTRLDARSTPTPTPAPPG